MPRSTPGLKMPSTPERDQMYRSLKTWCISRGVQLHDSQDSASTVPASDSQLAELHAAVSSQDRQPDFPASIMPCVPQIESKDLLEMQWAADWARELDQLVARKEDTAVIPAWAWEWAEELDSEECVGKSNTVQAGCAVNKECPHARSRSPMRVHAALKPCSATSVLSSKPKPSCAPHLRFDACNFSARVASLQSLVHLGAQEAAKFKAEVSDEEEFHRFISDGSPVRDLEELAMFLMKLNLYGQPHNIRLIQSRGKPCGILVQPNWGGSLSVYLKSGKMNLQGPLHARHRLLSLVKHATQKARPSGVQEGLPDPACISARLKGT
ncbi:unnamed protein product [Symbiodinium sp. CCMP2592]|nr:unnamed protein product [Symbiodinium sp. CCMP2592]